MPLLKTNEDEKHSELKRSVEADESSVNDSQQAKIFGVVPNVEGLIEPSDTENSNLPLLIGADATNLS